MAKDAPATAIVLYTGSLNSAVIDDAVNSGASALVLKTSPLQQVDAAAPTISGGTALATTPSGWTAQ